MPSALVALENVDGAVLGEVIRRDHEVDPRVQVERDLRIDDVRLVASEECHHDPHRTQTRGGASARDGCPRVDARGYERLREQAARLREQVEARSSAAGGGVCIRGSCYAEAARPQTPVAADERFDPEALAELREGAKRSAAVIAPVVQELVQAGSVIDVGGGEGWWADAFAGLGARAVSVDSATAAEQAPRVQHVHRNP